MKPSYVVETDFGKQIRQPYESGARDYMIGMSSGIMLFSTMVAMILIFSDIGGIIKQIALWAFTIATLLAVLSLVFAYTKPIFFYEVFEGKPVVHQTDDD